MQSLPLNQLIPLLLLAPKELRQLTSNLRWTWIRQFLHYL